MYIPKIDPPTIAVPWFAEGLRLAQQCLFRSTFAYVSGAQGTGKTHLGAHIEKQWKKQKLTGQVYILDGHETKVYRLARITYEAIVGEPLETRPRRTEWEIAKLILDNLAGKEASLLFVDGNVSKDHPGVPFLLNLLHGAQDRRLPVGLILTTWNAPFTLFELEQSDSYSRTLRLPLLKENQVVDVMAKWVPAFKDISKRYYENNPEARLIAKMLLKDTRGSFKRLAGLWRLSQIYGEDNLLCPNRICTLTGEHRRVLVSPEEKLTLGA